jgi:hypothetical protein
MTTTLYRTCPRQHVGEIRRRERLRKPPRLDCKAGGAVRGENQKQNVVVGIHPIGRRLLSRAPKRFDSWLGGVSEQRFQLGEHLLDRVEVRNCSAAGTEASRRRMARRTA